MPNLHVRPVPTAKDQRDRLVIMPDKKNRRMSPDGAKVPDDHYYRKLLKVGDIELVKPDSKAAAPVVKPAEANQADKAPAKPVADKSDDKSSAKPVAAKA